MSKHRSISETKVVKINFDAIEKKKKSEEDEGKGASFAARLRREWHGFIYSGVIQRVE